MKILFSRYILLFILIFCFFTQNKDATTEQNNHTKQTINTSKQNQNNGATTKITPVPVKHEKKNNSSTINNTNKQHNINNSNNNSKNSNQKTNTINNKPKTQQTNQQPVRKKDEIDKIIEQIEKKQKIINCFATPNNNTQKIKQENFKLETKNIPNDILETYAGMVGDKRMNAGLTLDLTMEARNIGIWTLIINGKNIQNDKFVKSYIQPETNRFFIDVNTNLIKDKTINFTYQMPKDIRLKYGRQETGYRIAIDLPIGTKIINKKISKDEIAVKFANQAIVDEYDKQKQIEEKQKEKNNSNVKNNNNNKQQSNKQTKQYDQGGLYRVSQDATFQTITLSHPKPYVVVIDPGHGGIDPGAKSSAGNYEKNITLKYAKALKTELEKYNFKVVMTRDKDKSVALIDRVKIAHNAKADLFISLHTDAHENPNISGTTVYRITHIDEEHPDWTRFYNRNYLPKQYTKYVNNHSVLDILVGMTHQTLSEKSSIIIDNILLSFKKNNICKICRHGQRALLVLRGLDMISILIEIGYISNKQEEEKILLESNIKTFTKNLAKTINDTFKE